MKRILTGFLAAVALISLSAAAFAEDIDMTEAAPNYTISVGEQALDLSDLPQLPYEEGNTIMVPLRKIAEALGYQVGWESETGAITIEDSYVQKATLYSGTEKAVFEGKLQIIDMSREIDNSEKTVIHSGYTYVPLEFFKEFFNDITIDGTGITVSPSVCELNTTDIGWITRSEQIEAIHIWRCP